MTEADKIALSISNYTGLFALEEVHTLSDARAIVRDHVHGETEFVINAVTDSLFNLAKRIQA